jgi:Na+-driven multidrug efflux pump
MIRGIIKALGIQNRILMAHVIVQGFFGGILTYFFGFYLGLGLNGIWLAKTCMIYSLVFYYIRVLY